MDEELKRKVDCWRQIAAENRARLANPPPPEPDTRPRDALTNELITFRGSAKANGKELPHITDPLPPPLF